MVIPIRQSSDDLFLLLEQVEIGTTVEQLISHFLIVVLKRNDGNRTLTAKELKIPLRTLRHRIWHMQALGYEVPEPEKGYVNYLKEKEKENKVKPKIYKKYE